MRSNQSNQQLEKLSELFHLYGSMMYDIAFSILKQEQDAEDAVQETLLKVMEKAGQIQPFEPLSMRAYIRTMTRNTALNMLRGTRFLIATDMNEEENQVVLSLSESDEITYQIHELYDYFHCLDEDEQQVLWMKYWERLTYRQIAKCLGITETAANSRVRRAQDHLKALYTNAGEKNG